MVCFFVNPIALEAKQCQALFEEAIQASHSNDFLEALGFWNQLLKLCPEEALKLKSHKHSLFIFEEFDVSVADHIIGRDELDFLEVDFHLDRGIAEEAFHQWADAEIDFNWILTHNSENASALYNLGAIKLAQEDWMQALIFFNKAALVKSNFLLALSSRALTNYQLGNLDKAETELRRIVLKYPMFADARAALSALLWHQGSFGEAKSHWAAAVGLDNRYEQQEWLLEIRRWPPSPTKDLLAFLALEDS